MSLKFVDGKSLARIVRGSVPDSQIKSQYLVEIIIVCWVQLMTQNYDKMGQLIKMMSDGIQLGDVLSVANDIFNNFAISIEEVFKWLKREHTPTGLQ